MSIDGRRIQPGSEPKSRAARQRPFGPYYHIEMVFETDHIAGEQTWINNGCYDTAAFLLA